MKKDRFEKKKKIIFRAAVPLALCAVTLLSCGCEAFLPGGAVSPIDTADITGGGADTAGASGTTEQGGTSDPADDNYGFAVFPEGNYLADPKFDTDEFLPDYDADLSFVQRFATAQSWIGTVWTTDDTVYAYVPGNYRILYVDKATGIWGPLCGKPECTHTNNNCNAYISSPDALRVYDGMLYWSGGRMKLDGTDRERGPWTDNYTKIQNNPEAVIHRGYVYTAGGDHMYSNIGAKSRVSINVTAMDGSESFNLLTKPLPGMGANCEIRPVGNDIYIEIYSFSHVDESDPESDYYSVTEFYRWSSKTRKAELLFICDGRDELGISVDLGGFLPVPGDGIYFRGGRNTEDGVVEVGTYKYSFETGEISTVISYLNYNDDRTERYYFSIECTKDHIFVEIITNAVGEDGKETRAASRDEIYDLDGTPSEGIAPPTFEHGGLLGMDDDFIYYTYYADGVLSESQIILSPLDGGEALIIGGEPEA